MRNLTCGLRQAGAGGRICATLALTGLLCAASVGGPALAKDSIPAAGASAGASKTVSLNLVNQPIQTALRLLFNSEGLNYSIAQNVGGTVSINVNNVSFDVALKALLSAANPPLAYDVNDGIYRISIKRRARPVAVAPVVTHAAKQETQGYVLPINQYDAGMIAQLIAGEDSSASSYGSQRGRRGSSMGTGGGGGVVIVPPNFPISSTGSGQGQSGSYGGATRNRGGYGNSGMSRGGYGGGRSYGGGSRRY